MATFFKVYLARGRNEIFNCEPTRFINFLDHQGNENYEHVANIVVDADEPEAKEEAWKLLQNDIQPWNDNDDVWLQDGVDRLRSFSVGDVLVNMEADLGDGVYMVDSVGFVDVE